MATREELLALQRMWTWLSAHPAHDQEYYMRHVARLDSPWQKSCPLCHSAAESCDSCRILWNTAKGSLCSDTDSPLNKWRNTPREDPDKRTYHANKVATLSMRAARRLGKNT